MIAPDKKYFERLLSKKNGSMIMQTASDLIKKDLFPKHALGYLKDPRMLESAIDEYNKFALSSFRCPDCGITMNAPKSWIIQHVKIHHMKKEAKENEIRDTKVNPYWEANRIKI